jgi:hypothetical protein
VLHPELVRELLHGRREALIAQHHGLDVEREVAQRADRLAVRLERARHDAARVLGTALVDRVHRRIEHQRDTGEVLDGPIVQEEREAAPLVLLGGDDPVGEAAALRLALRHLLQQAGVHALDVLVPAPFAVDDVEGEARGRQDRGDEQEKTDVNR